MDIVLCTDNNLVKQACVLITSILFTKTDEKIHFHILTLGISENSKKILEDCLHEKAKITFYPVLEKSFQNFPIHSSYLSLGTYLRFFIEDLLPEAITKVLYMDIDIVVVKSLKELWNTDIKDYSCAAALDLECHDVSRYNRLGYDMADLYFNAGLLLINLDWWRKNSVSKRAFDFLLKNPKKCLFHDQDALNYILHGKVLWISNSYNAMYAVFKSESDRLLILKEKFSELKRESSFPVIIHYAGRLKPWHKEYHLFNYPFGKIWLFFLQKSGVKIKIISYKAKSNNSLKKIIKVMLSALHLIKSEREKLKEPFVDTKNIENDLLKSLQEANK